MPVEKESIENRPRLFERDWHSASSPPTIDCHTSITEDVTTQGVLLCIQDRQDHRATPIA